MRPVLGDVNARARGLAAHCLPPNGIRRLAASRTVTAYAAELARAGYGAELAPPVTIAALDHLIATVTAGRLNLLADWLGPRLAAFEGLFLGREVAVLRALVRGIAGGVAPVARLRGLGPTRLLPAPALVRASAAESLAALHRVLAQSGHPAAEVMVTTGHAAAQGDLLRVELALRRWWADRVHAGARHAGREARQLASQAIDHQNLVALLLASSWGVEVQPEEMFLAGGQVLRRENFLKVAAEQDQDRRRAVLARAFGGTPAGRCLADLGIGVEALPDQLLAADLAAARRESALRPLGSAPLVAVVRTIEAEARNLRHALHAVALGAPPGRSAAGLAAA